MKTIDSIQPPAKRQRTSPARSEGSGARFASFGNSTRRWTAWPAVLIVGLSPILFVFALTGMVGVSVVILYGILAWVRRWPSRTTFLLALAALVYMVLLQLAAANDVAQSMAVLAYVLLAIGVISLAIEVKMSSRVWFKKH